MAGTKSYQAPVSIRGNAEIVGTLNGIRPDKDLVTLATNQVISGNWIIKAPIHFKKNLNAGTVNGIDFSKEVVLRNRGPQVMNLKSVPSDFVSGPKSIYQLINNKAFFIAKII